MQGRFILCLEPNVYIQALTRRLAGSAGLAGGHLGYGHYGSSGLGGGFAFDGLGNLLVLPTVLFALAAYFKGSSKRVNSSQHQ